MPALRTPPADRRKMGRPALRTMSLFHARSRSPGPGFTLLELVLSLGLIAVVASFAISAFFEQSDMTLHNALRLLAEDIRETQARATTLQIQVEIVFDPQGDGYHAEDRGTPEPRRAKLFPLVARRYSSDGVFEGVHVARLDLKGSDRIAFDAAGRSLASGTIILSYHGEARVLDLRTDRGYTFLPDSPRTRGWLDRLH